jgi:trehalose 6-phosphate synthase/phosphatase
MSQTKNGDNELAIDRLVIVSNRLPIVIGRVDLGEWQVQPGSGGLVTALAPILRDRAGLWIGWPGTVEDVDLDGLVAIGSQDAGYMFKPVLLTTEEVDQYYFGFSNEIIWPLFHDMHSRCNFDPAYWNMYQAVNRKFTQVIAQNTGMNDYIWVHDYHLMLVAKELRGMGLEHKIGFFLHIPFPPLDIYMKLPWRSQILEALLEYDLVGFQTRRDRNNFIQCAEALIKDIHYDARRQVSTITVPNREIKVGIFPISIDFKEFARQAAAKSVKGRASQLYEAIPNCQIILGVDRLDYSKGIPEKLRAFRNALERFDDLHGNVSLVQIVVPSREDIPEYQGLKADIEGFVSEINGKFTQSGWIPIHYMFRSLDWIELLAYYRAAEIALVTPLKDGMNLVAKEYCGAKVDRNGVLILSEFAGAATQLRRSSLLVNPYDIEGTANAIHRAYNMSTDERRLRMRRLRTSIAKRDIFWWLDFFLRAAIAK